MVSSVVFIKRDGAVGKPITFIVIAFNYRTKEYEFITDKVYDNLAVATMQNTVAGNNPPKIRKVDYKIEVSLKTNSTNEFYLYFRQLLHSCIPREYTGNNDCYVSTKDFLDKTGHSVIRMSPKTIATHWLKAVS